MTKNIIVFSCVLALAVLMAGCGGGSPKATFDKMAKAAKADDMDAMYACFTAETQADLKELDKLTENMPEGQKGPSIDEAFKKSDPVYGEEVITGDTATLEVTIEGKKQPINFVKVSGDWKIDMHKDLQMAIQMFKQMGEMMKGMGENMGDMMKNMPGAGEKK